MFILSLTYVAPMEEVDALLEEHMAWIKANYATGRFLAWGRKKPGAGEMIFVRAENRKEAEAAAIADPFVVGGVATVEVIEFVATFADDGLEALEE